MYFKLSVILVLLHLLQAHAQDSICIDEKSCNCLPDEEFTPCGGVCAPTCIHPDPTVCRPPVCIPECICAKGTVRDENTGKCIKPSDCFRCPKGEHYETCGSACPPTCENPKPHHCLLRCVSGCFCNNGTIRDTVTKKCVPPKKCICPKNKEYNDCGSACPETCQYPIERCTKECVPGCFCPNGTVEDLGTKECVPRDKCRCPPGKIYKCDSPCPPTCANPFEICLARKCKYDCFCLDGTILDETTGKCVKPEDCPCPKGEEISDCGGDCQATCTNPGGRCGSKYCIRSCVCPKGTVRDETTGNCVKPEECVKCPDGEIPSECGGDCQATCTNPRGSCDPKKCKPGCVCAEGTIRNETTGLCVKPEECQICPKGEEPSPCGGDCQATCNNPKGSCDPEKCKPGCVCPKGTIRDETTGNCVKPEECIKCPDGEIPSECGGDCQATCTNPKGSCDPEKCKPGCVCADGTIRNETTGRCVKPEECTQCPKGEEPSECGGDCQPTCNNPRGTCDSEKCKPGCVCAKGTVRNPDTNECVPVEFCVKKS